MSTIKTFSVLIRKVALMASASTLLALSPLALADDVVALKHALYGAGYDIENVSPELGSTTRAELERFQRDQGLEPTGALDEPTERALGMISVQQAGGTTQQPVAGNTASPAESSAAPQAEPAAAEGAAVEEEGEDEDGGWSLW